MRDFVGYLAVSLFGLAGVTMFLIVREVLPLLSPEDQITIAIYGAPRGRRASGQAIINCWNEHARAFPQSKKRLMVILFVAAGIFTFLSYPLWRTFAK
jgi:hypothetical protein